MDDDGSDAPAWRAVDGRGAEIAVHLDVVANEISPADWAELRLERLGHHPWAVRERQTSIGRVSDLLTRSGSGESGRIARTNVAKDGQRLFTVVCSAPEASYRALAQPFLAALTSFQLTQPEGAPHAEPLLTYSYLEPAVLSFMHPRAFDLMADGFDDDTFDVRLDARRDGVLLGSLHAFARKRERPQRLVAEQLARLEAASIVVDERGALVESPPPDGFDRSFTVEACGRWGETPVLARMCVLVNDAAAVLLATTGPMRAHDPYGWAVTRRALDVARDTLYAL